MNAMRHGGVGLWLLVSALGCNGAGPAVSDTTRPVAEDPADSAEFKKPETPEKKPRPEGDPQPTLPIGKVELEVENRQLMTLKVEVASTPEQQQMGLMFRETMADDAGMLFVFPLSRHQSFWMRNTLLPLDMFFINSQWTVVGVVENAEPLTEDPREVEGESQYVLEVNAGFAKAHGFGPGTKVRYTPPEGI